MRNKLNLVPRPSVEVATLPLLVNIRQVAAMLGKSTRYVNRRDSAGTMPARAEVVGTSWVRREIEEWIDEGTPNLENDRLRYRRKRAQ